jgi:hypothetical protein
MSQILVRIVTAQLIYLGSYLLGLGATMRLIGQIQITMASAEAVRREPGFWDKLKRGLGGKVDLDTGEVRVALEATALVDQVKRAFARVGIDNAVSLVIDDTVIFQDSDGRAGDLPDLVLALSEHASVFGRGFREMKLAVEHEEASLHLLAEVRAVTQHRRGEPSAYVSVGGRIRDLEPRTGESADAYRARVEPLAKDAGLLETARMQFQSFVGRLEAALRAALPEATVEEKRAEAVVVRPTTQPAAPAADPRSPVYDPYALYYPSPVGTMLDVLMISSFMSMMAPPPMIMVVHPSGVPIGGADTIASHPEAVAASALDPGDVGGSHDADYGGDHADSAAGSDDAGGDFGDNGGGFDDGGGGFDDGGGGFDGGGFDGGGGDF